MIFKAPSSPNPESILGFCEFICQNNFPLTLTHSSLAAAGFASPQNFQCLPILVESSSVTLKRAKFSNSSLYP